MRTVALDLDGTILDSMPTLESIAVNLGMHAEDYRATTGRPFAEQVALACPGAQPRLVHAFEDAKAWIYEHGLDIFPDTREALEHLATGWRVCIASSTRPEQVAAIVDKFELPIDCICVQGKRRALRHADLFIGDSDFDGQLAIECRVSFRRVDYPRGLTLSEVVRGLGV